MTGDIAESIRLWLCQDRVEMVGMNGERSRGSVRVPVQTDVRVANFTEDINGSAVSPTITPSLINNLIPEGTEIMLQFSTSITYVELAE